MNFDRFEYLLSEALDARGIPPAKLRVKDDVMTFLVDGRVQVSLAFTELDGEVDVLVSIGSRKKVVTMWKSLMDEGSEGIAQCIDTMLATSRHASRVLTASEARKIALAFQPMMTTESKTAASIASTIRRMTKLVAMLSKNASAWKAFLSAVGASASEGIASIAKKVWDFAMNGKKVVKDLVKRLTNTFPLSLYFVPQNRVPTLTDLLKVIMDKVPGIKNALGRVKDNVVQPLSDLLDKYLPTLQKPVIAALFAWIWINVAEISWDFKDLVRGFTGMMSLAELFETLPESGIGLIFAMFGVGYHLLPVMVLARILWLVANNYLEWKDGSISVRWDRLGVPGEKPLTVSVS